jgi:beta-xylosidase
MSAPENQVPSGSTSEFAAAGPAVPGLFADPALVVLDGRYWIYPTTDGTAGWDATAFRAFSSSDLVDWTDHGEIFSVPRDTEWATGHAWAPVMVQRDGRYYFYFTADQNIGVAVGETPTGPFVDIGAPLVPAERYTGAAIDPAVFIDDDGQAYLYWGSAEAHAVPLHPDLVSFDADRVMTWALTSFREALWVHRRADTYYLAWSENDTREADYRVRYATGSGPLGPWVDRGILLQKDAGRRILGTGHHSVARILGTDEWLIAYHRFAIPQGDGQHREIAIDTLTHRPDGLLDPVRPGNGARRAIRVEPGDAR